jgi:4-amino-4-deoxy-L-arabinose transferase-like glycosyltransferase
MRQSASRLRAALYLAGAVSLLAAIRGLHSDGKLAGVAAGLALAALLSYALLRYALPQWRDRDSGLRAALLVLLAIAIVKFALLPWCPGFLGDINSYRIWALDLIDLGPAETYPGFNCNYPPGYLYALWVVGIAAHLTGATGETLRMLVETPPLIADFILAATMFIFVRRRGHSAQVAWFCMLAVALNPALLFDTLLWGQSDSVLAIPALLSIMCALDSEFELAWMLAALAVLAKPQALLYLPVLALWTLLRGDFRSWLRSAAAFIALVLIGFAPFQIRRYFDAVYAVSVTSANAFNLMALIGGLFTDDSKTIAGVSFFTIGMCLFLALYLAIAWLLWRRPSARNLLHGVFLATFGAFILGPRMHERYFYLPLVVAVPLAVEEPAMLVVLAALTATCLFNMVYVKQVVMSASRFMAANDPTMLADAVLALAIFLYALRHTFTFPRPINPGVMAPSAAPRRSAADRPGATPQSSGPGLAVTLDRLTGIDWLVLTILIALALTRLWRLGTMPAAPEELEFVGQARAFLTGQRFVDSQPPLAVQTIALCIRMFGDQAWSWRLPMAMAGTGLVGITYLLGRRMFGSRLAATLAALFILGDGMFLVLSRVALPEMGFVTLAALAYLILFRFAQNPAASQRWTLVALGLTLGLCMASALYAPVVVFVLVMGSLVAILVTPDRSRIEQWYADSGLSAFGALLLVSSAASLVYLFAILPNSLWAHWGGLESLWQYYLDAGYLDDFKRQVPDLRASPWWGWPLMLRPVTFWQDKLDTGEVATVMAGGNPVLWWGAASAIAVAAVRQIRRASLAGVFVAAGYLALWVAWLAMRDNKLLTDFTPALYLGYLALAAVLARCWLGAAGRWEQAIVMLALAPALVLGFGAIAGTVAFALLAGAWIWLGRRDGGAGQLVCASFLIAALVAYVYFMPLWIGLPISPAGYQARAWFHPGGPFVWQ